MRIVESGPRSRTLMATPSPVAALTNAHQTERVVQESHRIITNVAGCAQFRALASSVTSYQSLAFNGDWTRVNQVSRSPSQSSWEWWVACNVRTRARCLCSPFKAARIAETSVASCREMVATVVLSWGWKSTSPSLRGRIARSDAGEPRPALPFAWRRRAYSCGAYCISPLPNDQFSRGTSTRLIHTSSLRRPVFA